MISKEKREKIKKWIEIWLALMAVSLFYIPDRALRVFLFVIVGSLIFLYLFIFTPVDKNAKLSPKYQIIVNRIVFWFCLLALVYGFSPFVKEYLEYKAIGEEYLQKEVCVIDKTYSLTLYPFAKHEITCKNNDKVFKKFLWADYYAEWNVYLFYYLPKNRIIVRERLIQR